MVEARVVGSKFEQRAAVVESLCAGRAAAKIISFFNYLEKTVYDIVRTYNDTENSGEGSASALTKIHDRPKPVRTHKIEPKS